MTDDKGTDKRIKCTNCKCKYINDDENIKKEFGFNGLNEKFKTCVKCRGSSQKAREKKLQEEVEENEQRCPRCYKSKPANDFVGHTFVYKTCGACRLKDKGSIW